MKRLSTIDAVGDPTVSSHCVYKICFPNGKFYFGCTKGLKKRMVAHKSTAVSPVQKEVKRHDLKTIEVIAVTGAVPKGIARKIEAELIHDHYNDDGCLNQINHISISTKTTKKIRETMKRLHREGRYKGASA